MMLWLLAALVIGPLAGEFMRVGRGDNGWHCMPGMYVRIALSKAR